MNKIYSQQAQGLKDKDLVCYSRWPADFTTGAGDFTTDTSDVNTDDSDSELSGSVEEILRESSPSDYNYPIWILYMTDQSLANDCLENYLEASERITSTLRDLESSNASEPWAPNLMTHSATWLA
ncbi:hypothetical protein QQZ08_002423 [Neonectria magnoliae]|uniref:Uncharacterized protein n=1 Tax=Neonectria magnoliae TaxID=2732573 RepID=A0ABR1ICX8_9HYPO